MTLQTLTEGIRARHMGATHARLTEKWNRTGLLRGLQGYNRENMAVLLENQAAQVLKESNALGGNSAPASSGAVAGFQNVAFPIVRRVFGGLVANELVSIQPMSLPAGLLFYLDYTYGSDVGGTGETYSSGGSIYNNPVGAGIRSGSTMTGGQYDLLGSGYSRQHSTAGDVISGSAEATLDLFEGATFTTVANPGLALLNIVPATGVASVVSAATLPVAVNPADLTVAAGLITTSAQLVGVQGQLLDFDSVTGALLDGQVLAGLEFAVVSKDSIAAACDDGWLPDYTMLQDLVISAWTPGAGGVAPTAVPADVQPGAVLNLRRFTKSIRFGSANQVIVDPLGGTHILFVLNSKTAKLATVQANTQISLSFAADSARVTSSNGAGDSTVIPTFESTFASNDPLEAPVIPEIDIKIESLSVVATSRKLKAKWSPELAQDLNAYHSLDAEVELTQILSEQIALELDREILNDLLTQANGANLFWSRAPGKFVNKLTGAAIERGVDSGNFPMPGPTFTGTVQDWYSTLVETIIDAGNIIQRKTLRGSANFIVVGTDVATVLESSVMYKPNYSIDGQGQAGAITIGAEKVGSLSNRFTVYKDPYFPRNRILIGYKGGSYLETGYVYAPYVPLIVTPTMFAPEDFTPRKGVMTRYGKKMVRSDFYGTVTCLDMHII
jgi:hypothetical protein